MKNWIWIAVLIAIATALGAQNASKPKSIFSMLKVGQTVSVKDHGTAYSISFFDDVVPLSHSVVEVGDDFVVVQDVAGITETTVPVYALKSIAKMRKKLK